MSVRCLVDAHTHLYSCFDIQVGLDSAARHFEAARRRLSLPPETAGVLLLARARDEPAFDTVSARLERAENQRWRVVSPTESESARLVRTSDQATLFLIQGFQVRTRSGLEVLALASTASVPDGDELAPTVHSVQSCGAITVIPWGVGKWFGRRGRQVRQVLGVPTRVPLFVGDNSGRPSLMAEPQLFSTARSLGIYVLPGSDPLPVAGQERTIGRYGLLLDGFESSEPTGSVRDRLMALRDQPVAFGNRESLLRSVVLQTRMQVRRCESVIWPNPRKMS